MLLPQLAVLLTSLITVTEGVMEEVMEEKKNLSSLAESETRIVGGTVVDPPHKYPFQVSPLPSLFIFLKRERSTRSPR